jgi:large conductance mechanosensitive channel
MIREFKEFIAKGSAIDLAVGLVMGAAFTAIVKALVDGVIMPVVGLLLGNVEFTNLFIVLKADTPGAHYVTLKAAQDAGAVVISWGVLVNAIVTFFFVALVIFFMIKAINRVRQPDGPVDMKDCPYCATSIPDVATRCPACTSELAGSA